MAEALPERKTTEGYVHTPKCIKSSSNGSSKGEVAVESVFQRSTLQVLDKMQEEMSDRTEDM